ncbi:MAG: APC family permease [bacterium]
MTPAEDNHPQKSSHIKLGALSATAICGNDILSSVLYVSGLVIPIAGIWAPVAMLLVGVVLFLYRGVYREVVESLPINGGTYNALLNATTKKVAVVAGLLTILSYVATAVISAKSGVDYLFNWSVIKNSLPATVNFDSLVTLGTIGVLLFFAGLAIAGVKDSAKVAVGIFVTHITTLLVLILFATVFILHNPGSLHFSANIANTHSLVDSIRDLTHLGGMLPFLILLFLGFSTSLLGVSGFESSANFIEEQKDGVFKKTLTNMAIGVTVINPLIAVIFLYLFDLNTIHEQASYLLAYGGLHVGGEWLAALVVIDAFLVLCGAVLASFVGVSGLVARMTLDECLPAFLKKQNNSGSYLYIIFGFFLFCVSILFVSKGELPTLGGIYAIAFLAVMSMFAISNLILKNNRESLKRKFYWPTPYVIAALISTILGLAGNMIARDGKLGDSSNLIYFLEYFFPLFIFLISYLNRDNIYIWVTGFLKKDLLSKNILEQMTSGKYVIFLHDIGKLFHLLEYIDMNEVGRNVLIVHCSSEDEASSDTFSKIEKALPVLQETGAFNHLSIQVVHIDCEFGPEAVSKISKKYGVANNHMFIGAIHEHHDFDYDELGGVRIIAA